MDDFVPVYYGIDELCLMRISNYMKSVVLINSFHKYEMQSF